MTVPTVDRDELHALVEAGDVVLVEALPERHYDTGHLPGAVNVPGELTAGLAGRLVPDRARTVVTYCSGRSCRRSKTVATAFTRLGYTDVRVYPGGKADWVEAGLPFDGARAVPKAVA